jgi:NAD+ diphosphatase
MHFIPAIAPRSEGMRSSWWFAFREDKLLVEEKDRIITIPFIRDLTDLNLEPIRKQYLGELDGSPCYSVELVEDAVSPKGMQFLGLRKLFERTGEDLFGIAGKAFQIVNWDRNHQYCGRCGAPNETKSDERAKVCPRCGMLHYPRLSPAIIVAVINDNQILLAHADRFLSGFYSVLAGFVEPGEAFEECVKREVKEEVGIMVKNIRYFGSQPWPFPNSLMVGFTADYDSGKISIDGIEIKDAGWFKANDLPRIPGKISIARRLIDWFVERYH